MKTIGSLAILALLTVGCGEMDGDIVPADGVGGSLGVGGAVAQAGTGGQYHRDPAPDCEGTYQGSIGCNLPNRVYNKWGSLCGFCTFDSGEAAPVGGCAVRREETFDGKQDIVCVDGYAQCVADCPLY